ncbi:MAG: hypothetical protein ABJA71_07340, partial [Ginsengibacter sp.]
GLILTDGDNKKLTWINKSGKYDIISKDKNSGWKKINRFHCSTKKIRSFRLHRSIDCRYKNKL